MNTRAITGLYVHEVYAVVIYWRTRLIHFQCTYLLVSAAQLGSILFWTTENSGMNSVSDLDWRPVHCQIARSPDPRWVTAWLTSRSNIMRKPEQKDKVKSFRDHIRERDGFLKVFSPLTHEQLSITVARTLCPLNSCSYVIGVWLSDRTNDKDAGDRCPLVSTLQH